MGKMLRRMAVAVLMLTAYAMPEQAPAGATGQCKDGSYSTAASKVGACRGHQGVKSWFAEANTTASGSTAAAKPSAGTATAKGNTAAGSSPTAPTSKKAETGAPGGPPKMVWVNRDSNVYHCPGTKYYGKTKTGSYMTEAAAKAQGARPDHNQPCSK